MISLKKALVTALAGVVLLNLLLIAGAGGHWHGSAPADTAQFLRLRQGHDSWGPMSAAYAYLAVPHLQTVYQQIFFAEKSKFQYPLSSLLVYAPLHGYVKPVFLVISWFFLLANLAAAVAIYLQIRGPAPGDTASAKRQEMVLLVLLGLLFYPLVHAFILGQIQVWINALVAIAFWLWLRGRPGVSGVLIGLCCLIKPQYAIILLWGLLRRQGRFAAGLGITFAAGLLVSVLIFGLHENLDYLSVIKYVGPRGEAFNRNQSFNGLLNRGLFNGDNLFWQAHAFPPLNPWVSGGTTLTSLLLIAAALFWPRRKDERGKITDLMTVTLSATMASPIAWEHHYGILLPIYALLLPRLHRTPVWGRATLPLLALSYLLAAACLSITDRLAATPLNVLQSYLLLGALLALALLYRLQTVPGEDSQTHPSPSPGTLPERVYGMTLFVSFSLLLLLTAAALPTAAQPPASALRYKFTQGETLRYLIQRDPYFSDPEGAVAAVITDAQYRPPVVERLTETVQKVNLDGTATLTLTLRAEPGFEDEAYPQPALTRTVTVTPAGQVLLIAGGPLGRSPGERDLLRGLTPLPSASRHPAPSGLTTLLGTQPASVTQRKSPDHDGTLLRTTQSIQSDKYVFDGTAGCLVRSDSTLTISSSLVMTGRGRRGGADFGHVVPHLQVIQTLSVERQDDPHA